MYFGPHPCVGEPGPLGGGSSGNIVSSSLMASLFNIFLRAAPLIHSRRTRTSLTSTRPDQLASTVSGYLLSGWINLLLGFVLAERHFRLHGINREQTRWDYLVSDLTRRPSASSSTWWSILQRGFLHDSQAKYSSEFSSVDWLSEDCRTSQDGALGGQEAFRAAGLYPGALSSRSRGFYILHIPVPGEAPGCVANYFGWGWPLECEGIG
jgi:hypothetical protein